MIIIMTKDVVEEILSSIADRRYRYELKEERHETYIVVSIRKIDRIFEDSFRRYIDMRLDSRELEPYLVKVYKNSMKVAITDNIKIILKETYHRVFIQFLKEELKIEDKPY